MKWSVVLLAALSAVQGEIRYDDVASLMAERWAGGQSRVPQGDEKVFLRGVLDELGVPEESQMLVFSKSSQQNSQISPKRPRAIYFSDDVYVGWVQGGFVELISHDGSVGPLFSVVQRQPEKEVPFFQYSEDCLSCHEGSRTRNVPGMQVRSLFTSGTGQPLLAGGSFLSEHDSPLEERWGGWYVTGRHGEVRHMGNALATQDKEQIYLDREVGANLTTLDHLFDPTPYLRADSDIVALLVLEHQVGMHNRLTEAQQYFKNALKSQQAWMGKSEEPTSRDQLEGSVASVARTYAGKVVEYMLFADEAALPEDGIEGGEDFQEAFRRNRIESERGDSLKDFQLLSRLFKNRCSYMIYSHAFASLRPALKDEVLFQLRDALMGGGAGAHLGESERRRILAILRETVDGFEE